MTSLLLIVTLAARFEQRDPGMSGPAGHVAVEVGAGRLLCPSTDALGQLVVLFEADALAEHLVSHGFAVLLARAAPVEAFEALLRAPPAACGELSSISVVARGAASYPALRLVDALDAIDLMHDGRSIAAEYRVVLLDPVEDGGPPLGPPRERARSWSPFCLGSLLVLQGPDAPSARGLIRDAFRLYEIDQTRLSPGDNALLSRRLITGWLFNAWSYQADYVFENLYVVPAKQAGELTESRESPDRVDPITQFNVSLLVGPELRSRPGAGVLAVRLSARPELIFLRKSSRSLGLGPYLEIGGSAPSGDGQLGAGATLVVPVTTSSHLGLFNATAVAPSVGAYLAGPHFEPGLTAGLSFAFRAFNDISHFEGLAGVRVDGRWGFGPTADRAVVLSLQLDATLLVAFFAFAG